MPVDLDKLLDLTNVSPDERAMLDDLQANILKGHGRDHTANLFLHFDADRIDRVRAHLARLGERLTSAADQLDQVAVYKARKVPGEAVTCFFLTSKGYQALGVPDAQTPKDAKFQGGMIASAGGLKDPDPAGWDETFRQGSDDRTIHAMMLIADTDPYRVEELAYRRGALLESKGIRVLGVEIGNQQRQRTNPANNGIEQFGYVDGRSQPLFIRQDVEREAKTGGGSDDGFFWDPAFNLSRLLVRDPGGEADTSHGSYFVFRKLEEDVKGFKTQEEALADALKLTGPDRERAGALVIGRFEDGTPVALAKDDGVGPDNNDFSYKVSDPDGQRCPFRGHIRKTNPRGESVGKFAQDVAQERAHIMARRGITYGDREDDPNDGQIDNKPSGGVGLLFMAYNVDLPNQFEFTQKNWVNFPEFVREATGIDPVIGQGTNPPGHAHWIDGWSQPPKEADFDFKIFVKMMGGEYFFAPSRSFLKSLAAVPTS